MLDNMLAALGLVKPKKDPLFVMEIELDPYTDNLDQRCETMRISVDGSVYNNRKLYVGKIPEAQWRYIRQFDKPSKMSRTGYNRFTVEISGDIDKSKVFPDPGDKPYIYKCGDTLFMPYMVPGQEYYCELVDQQDHFDVLVDGKKLGELKELKDRNRVSKLRAMLDKGYQATAQIELTLYKSILYLIVRKV